MAEKKQEYVVTAAHAGKHARGDRVKLTEAEAARLVNKVRNADEADKAAAESVPQKQHDAVVKELAELRDAHAANIELLGRLDTAAAKDKALADALASARAGGK